MKLERYNSNGRFHEAVIHNGTIYLSGQISDEGETVAQQTLSCLEILEGKLEKYGSDKKHIISASVYLPDMGTFDEFNGVWDNWFEEGSQPVRTCVGAALSDTKFKVEITLIAAVKEA